MHAARNDKKRNTYGNVFTLFSVWELLHFVIRDRPRLVLWPDFLLRALGVSGFEWLLPGSCGREEKSCK